MSERPRIYVYGASGQGKVVAEAILEAATFELAGFVDDDRTKRGQVVMGVQVIGNLTDLKGLASDAQLMLAVGDNRARLDLRISATLSSWTLATVVHPSATVSSTARLGAGTYVGPSAVVHVDALVGSCCILNTGSVIEHDCRLGDGVHVSPNATLGGNVTVGHGSQIGLGAVVLPGLAIGDWTRVGAGAVVTRGLPSNVVAVGMPARIRVDAK